MSTARRVSYSLNFRKNKFFPSLLQATSGCSNVGTESKIFKSARSLKCVWSIRLFSLFFFYFNKSIFAEVFRHESIQENPIGIRVPCVHAQISNIPFFLHFAISLEYDVVCMSGHGCYLLFIGKFKLENTRDIVR